MLTFDPDYDLHSMLPQVPPPPVPEALLEDFAAYSRVELPRLVRQQLEVSIGLSMEEWLRSQIIDIVHAANQTIIQAFQRRMEATQQGQMEDYTTISTPLHSDQLPQLETGELLQFPAWTGSIDETLMQSTVEETLTMFQRDTVGPSMADSGYGTAQPSAEFSSPSRSVKGSAEADFNALLYEENAE